MEVKPLGAKVSAGLAFPALGIAPHNPLNCEAHFEAGECPCTHPETRGSSRTSRQHFLPWEDRPAARLDTRLTVVWFDSLSLPGELRLVVVCSSSVVCGAGGVGGGKKRAGNSQLLCWCPAGPWALPLGLHVPAWDPWARVHSQPSGSQPSRDGPVRSFQVLGAAELIPPLWEIAMGPLPPSQNQPFLYSLHQGLGFLCLLASLFLPMEDFTGREQDVSQAFLWPSPPW